MIRDWNWGALRGQWQERFCCSSTYKCARKTTQDSLRDDPRKMETMEGKRTGTNAHMHVRMPTQEPKYTPAQEHVHKHTSAMTFHWTILLCLHVIKSKNNGSDMCCTDHNSIVAMWCKTLPADLGQLTLKKWWFPQSILSPWCKGILSVTGRPFTYDRAFASGSIISPPSSIIIIQCSGWIPSPESWMSCSMGASRPPTKVRSCIHKEQYQKSVYVTDIKL